VIALAYAGGLGLTAVAFLAMAGLASMTPRRLPLVSSGLAVAGLITIALMVAIGLFGTVELILGALS
jgi:hypothetical protein